MPEILTNISALDRITKQSSFYESKKFAVISFSSLSPSPRLSLLTNLSLTEYLWMEDWNLEHQFILSLKELLVFQQLSMLCLYISQTKTGIKLNI